MGLAKDSPLRRRTQKFRSCLRYESTHITSTTLSSLFPNTLFHPPHLLRPSLPSGSDSASVSGRLSLPCRRLSQQAVDRVKLHLISLWPFGPRPFHSPYLTPYRSNSLILPASKLFPLLEVTTHPLSPAPTLRHPLEGHTFSPSRLYQQRLGD